MFPDPAKVKEDSLCSFALCSGVRVDGLMKLLQKSQQPVNIRLVRIPGRGASWEPKQTVGELFGDHACLLPSGHTVFGHLMKGESWSLLCVRKAGSLQLCSAPLSSSITANLTHPPHYLLLLLPEEKFGSTNDSFHYFARVLFLFSC